MRCLALSKRKRIGRTSDIPPVLIAALVALGTSLVATGAFAQSSSRMVSRGVLHAGVTVELGRAPSTPAIGAVTPALSNTRTTAFSNTPTPAFSHTPTPAFLNTPTPAFSNTPTPAFSNTPTPALFGTPTRALSETQTSPIGGMAASISVDGATSGGVTVTISTNGATSTDAFAVGAGDTAASRRVAAQRSGTGLPASRVDSFGTVNPPADPFAQMDANSTEAGSVVVSGDNRTAGTETGRAFVILTDPPALDAPATRPMRFTMICNSSRDTQAGCRHPPRFVAKAK